MQNISEILFHFKIFQKYCFIANIIYTLSTEVYSVQCTRTVHGWLKLKVKVKGNENVIFSESPVNRFIPIQNP